MTLRVVGAGVGRTGTHSLKVALEQLLGGTCHHMMEVFGRPHEVPVWQAAADGQMPDWHDFLGDFTAAVDWPSAAYWPELAEAYPDAIVLLSVRSPEAWWKSANDTIFNAFRDTESVALDEIDDPWKRMVTTMLRNRFGEGFDATTMQAAYAAHNQRARDTIDPARLVEWTATDGWEPICAALGVPVPDEPFPLTNTTDDFRERMGLGPL